MRVVIFLLSLALAAPASAQLVVPLATADGRVACVQGKTGIGQTSEWRAVADADGPNGWSLAETAGDPTDSRFPLCVAEQAVGRDVDATLRFKPVSGTRAQVAGLIFRAQSANDYYFVQANALDKTVRLYRMEKGKRNQLARKDAAIETGKWHSLRVVAANDHFAVTLDGKPMFEVTDRSLPQAGAIGVITQADSVTHFGSLLLSPPQPR